jgi:hypothetical protein
MCLMGVINCVILNNRVRTDLNIIRDDNKSAVGFAKPLPAEFKDEYQNLTINQVEYLQYPVPSHEQPQKSRHPVKYVRDCNPYHTFRRLTRPMLPDGVRPRPPIKPAHISDKISP